MTQATSPARSPQDTTPLQALIEQKDGRGRGIQAIVRDAYERHGRLADVAAELTRLLEGTGQKVTLPAVHRWTRSWKWEIETRRRIVKQRK